jgi:hypothetical protein
VRGRDGQRAAVLRRKVVAGALQVVGLAQQAFDDGQHHLAGWRQAGQPLAGAHEQVDAEFMLQLADLAAHAWLRGVSAPAPPASG